MFCRGRDPSLHTKKSLVQHIQQRNLTKMSSPLALLEAEILVIEILIEISSIYSWKKIRKRGENGLFIKLVPKVFNDVFLFIG